MTKKLEPVLSMHSRDSRAARGFSKVNMSLMAVCAFRIKLTMSACRRDLVRKKTGVALPEHNGIPKVPLGVKLGKARGSISCIGPVKMCPNSSTHLRLLAGRSESNSSPRLSCVCPAGIPGPLGAQAQQTWRFHWLQPIP